MNLTRYAFSFLGDPGLRACLQLRSQNSICVCCIITGLVKGNGSFQVDSTHLLGEDCSQVYSSLVRAILASITKIEKYMCIFSGYSIVKSQGQIAQKHLEAQD